MISNLAEAWEEEEDTGPWSFDDAPEEIKKLAIEREREAMDFHHDFVYDDFKEQMDEKGITVDEIYYSGFWCQGDGACFEGSISDWEKFFAATCKPEDFQAIRNCKADNMFVNFSSKHSGHYYHSNSVDYDFDHEDPRNLIDYDPDDLRYHVQKVLLDIPSLEKDLEALYQHCADTFKTFMDELYKDLEKEWDHQNSDEAIAEGLSGLMIDEDGVTC